MIKQKKKTKQNAAWEYFDDCFICQSMKKVDSQGNSLNAQELKKVFEEQNRRNRLS